MARAVKHCWVCQVVCTDDHLSITPTVVSGPNRLSYKALAICSEQCLRAWANDLIWHADDDPRASVFIKEVEDG